MSLEHLKIGFAMTGSFCTFKPAMEALRALLQAGCEVYPIFSPIVYSSDTRFYKAQDLQDEVRLLTGHDIITTIVEAEPIGPRHLLDAVVICPCTGNTAAKFVNGITDTAVLMSAKSQLRNGGPVLVAIATNDGLSNNGKTLGMLQNMKQVYLVPYGQDDSQKKPTSLIAHMEQIVPALEAAMEGRQIQPLLQ